MVNERHASDAAMGKLLETFVAKNKCNLIWMDRECDIGYPSLDSTGRRRRAQTLWGQCIAVPTVLVGMAFPVTGDVL